MAKYKVTYKCGHTETIELFGKQEERYSKIEWMSKNCICKECLKKQHEEENAKAKEESENNGFCSLTGSEKQVAWATTIRVNKLNELMKVLGETENEKKIKAWFINHAEASWWIDNRNTTAIGILKSNQKEIAALFGM